HAPRCLVPSHLPRGATLFPYTTHFRSPQRCNPERVRMARPRFLPDNFTLCLVAAMATASVLPVQGLPAVVFGWITNLAIGQLYFMHGAKLSRVAIWAGATHWRLLRQEISCTILLLSAQ